ncbi:hypothetical protein [Mesorhizobium marinum]|uniref:hypothetical protein n=1 Tax=Mesorhizobium marinum TaxID=3228790 RepID=UPI0034656213
MRLMTLVLVLILHASWAQAQCKNETAIWATERDGIRHVVYGSNGVTLSSRVLFEEWRNSKLAWQVSASVTCSNGHSICRVMVPNASGLPGDAGQTVAIVEEIDQDGDGLSEWVVFAALGQMLYYAGGAKVVWYNDFKPGEFDRILIPNRYRFLACRDGGVPISDAEGADEPDTFVGSLFGIPELCRGFLASGKLVPDHDLSKNFQDGLWFMDDARIVGWEFGCDIEAKHSNKLDLKCYGEGDEWTESRSYSEFGPDTRKVGEVVLRRCSPLPRLGPSMLCKLSVSSIAEVRSGQFGP